MSTKRVRAAWGGILLAPLIVASAITAPASAGSKAQSGPSEAADYDPDGVLRVAMALMDRVPMKLDAETQIAFANGISSVPMLTYVFGTPLIMNRDGGFDPFLAESYEIVDENTVTLTMRDGLTYHDGTPLTAQTVADTMLGNQEWSEANAPGAYADSVLGSIESIDVVGDTELTFHLSDPVAGLMPKTLASQAAYLVSPTANPPETLYGAGPFEVEDFAFNDHLTVTKYEDYWDADSYLLGGIDFISIPTIEAAQNALQAGQVDLIATNPRDVDALVDRGHYESVITQNQGHFILTNCAAGAPFDDPKFREAFDLAIDREQLNEVVLGGNAAPMESLWNPGAPLAVEGLIDTDGDQDRARELLDEIGWDEDTVIPFGVVPGFQTHQLFAETIIGQVAKVGIKMEIVVEEGYDIPRFINPENGGVHFVANVQPGIESVTVPNTGASPMWNPCGVDDPDVAALADQVVRGTLDDDELVEAWTEIQELVTSRDLWYPLVSQPIVYVYDSDRVQGLQPGTVTLSAATAVGPFYEGVSIIGD